MQVLPHILSDRRQRLQVHESTVVQDATQHMNVAVQQLFTSVAELRQISDVVEGSVLMLGVPTTHALLLQLSHSMQVVEEVLTAWRTTAAAQAEHITQYRLLTVSMDQACNTMRERKDAAEKELRALRSERDHKDASFDKAVDYVQRVLAEHTRWQESCGYNTQQWPVVGACKDALTALHDALASTIGNTSLHSRSLMTELGHASTNSSVFPLRVAAGASMTSPSPPLREWTPVLDSSTDDRGDVAQRWSATANAWKSATNPSVRFAYIPPAEEVRLLQDVLAMGTGSTTLMRDIQAERSKLMAARAEVHDKYAKHRDTLKTLRQELAALRQHLNGLVTHDSPFTAMSADLVRGIRTCIDTEVARRLLHAPDSLYRTARTSTDELSTAEFRTAILVLGDPSDGDSKAWLTEA